MGLAILGNYASFIVIFISCFSLIDYGIKPLHVPLYQSLCMPNTNTYNVLYFDIGFHSVFTKMNSSPVHISFNYSGGVA